MFDWLNANDAMKFGAKLAEDLTADLVKVNNKSADKEMLGREKAIQKAFSQAMYYKKSHQLNFYKQSKLVNEFRWKLVELGHDKEFVELVAKDFVFYIQQ